MWSYLPKKTPPNTIMWVEVPMTACSIDEKQNIMHLIMGADRGLLITTNLSRQDLPLQTEVSIERAAKEGTVGSTIYSDKYNVDLTLVGNTLFAPGMAFYLDPTVLGIGKPGDGGSLASKMGIGGYYRVLSTECNISSGKFETIIKGNLELYGDSLSPGGGPGNDVREIPNENTPLTKDEMDDIRSLGG